MTQRLLQEQLHGLEEVSEDTLGYAPTCLKAATAAAEVGDLNACRTIIDRAITVFSQAELGTISAPLIGLYNELTHLPDAA